MERSPPGGDPRAISAKSFAHALRAYHGTLAPRWGFHPPRPAPFQLPAVAPSRSARPRAPHPQPIRPGVVPSPAARRLIWPWARKVLLGNEAPCIIIREFFTTVREGSSPQEELTLSSRQYHTSHHIAAATVHEDDRGADRSLFRVARAGAQKDDAGPLRVLKHPGENGVGQDHGLDVSMAKGGCAVACGCG